MTTSLHGQCDLYVLPSAKKQRLLSSVAASQRPMLRGWLTNVGMCRSKEHVLFSVEEFILRKDVHQNTQAAAWEAVAAILGGPACPPLLPAEKQLALFRENEQEELGL